MGLHGHVRVQMVQGAISFFAPIPTTFVHPLNFFISSAWSFVLLCTRYRNEGVDLLTRLAQLHHVRTGRYLLDQIAEEQRSVVVDLLHRDDGRVQASADEVDTQAMRQVVVDHGCHSCREVPDAVHTVAYHLDQEQRRKGSRAGR